MKFLVAIALCFSSIFVCTAQSLSKRIIFIGDAGEVNKGQESVIKQAEEMVIPSKTTVFYLGDNIYPHGMGLEGIEKEAGEQSLKSQYEGFRQQQVPVYFLAGNHDWNVSKPNGLAKLKAQEDFLLAQKDEQIALLPKAGEPGPYAMNLNDSLVAIIYDSEYWLYPHHEGDQQSAIKRKNFKDSLEVLERLHRDKTILVLSHHPMESFGEHGLKFGLKQHVFPLTRLNPKMYIPLPIIGSLYPLWRKHLFRSAEDIPHPLYKSLIEDVTSTFKKHKNVLYISGHDHGLQYLESNGIKQVVSGSASKTSFILNHKDLKFKYESQGFCILDFLDNEKIVLSYFTYDGQNIIKAFEKEIGEN